MKNPTLSYLLVTIASVATVLLPICAFAAPQILFESDFQSGTIFKFTSDGTKTTFASGLSGPVGLALDASENLLRRMKTAAKSSNSLPMEPRPPLLPG